MQHPVTTEYLDSKRQIKETIKSVKALLSKHTNRLVMAKH